MNYKNEDGSLNVLKLIKHIVGVLVVLVILFGSFGTIRAGERGVRTRFSAVVGMSEPGLYMKLPLVEKMTRMEVKTRTVNYDANGNEGDSPESSRLFGASRDLQDVWIGVVVNYHVDPQKVADIFSQYRSVENYELMVIEPIIREVVKSTSAQYTAEELVTKRAEFSEGINTHLAERFTEKDSILERFNVTNFEFSKTFTQAIEAKVTAVQNAEAAKNKLEQVKFEAQQAIEEAMGKARALSIEGQALAQNPQVKELRAIEKWNGVLPQVTGGAVPFVNIK